MALAEKLMHKLFADVVKVNINIPFVRMNYNDAMNNYGVDKPDTRFDLHLKETAANSFYERAVIERFRKRSGLLGKVCIQRSGDLREDLTKMGFSESI